MKTILILLAKNKFRQQFLLYKNWFFAYVCFFAAIVFIFVFRKSIYWWICSYNSYLNVFISCVALCFIVFKRFPIIIINPATILYFPDKKSIIHILYLKIICYGALLAVISYILVLIDATSPSIFSWLHYVTFLFFIILLSWHRYHKGKHLYIIFCFFSCCVFCFAKPEFSIILCTMSIFWLLKQVPYINWEKYMKDVKFLTDNMAAGARKDWGMMIQYANQNAIKDKYFFSFPKHPLCHPLFTKSLIDSWRVSQESWIVIFLSAAVGIFVLALGAVGGLSNLAFAIAWNVSLSTLLNRSIEAAQKMRQLHFSGLYLPYSKNEIAFFYSSCAFVIVVLLQLILFMTSCLNLIVVLKYKIGLCTVLLGLVFYLSHRVALRRNIQRSFVSIISSATIFVIIVFMMS